MTDVMSHNYRQSKYKIMNVKSYSFPLTLS